MIDMYTGRPASQRHLSNTMPNAVLTANRYDSFAMLSSSCMRTINTEQEFNMKKRHINKKANLAHYFLHRFIFSRDPAHQEHFSDL